ncbi:MAG: [protein-PII] uridylyltransferase [Polyangiaceae bacterium]|nr:[protein-PII] uridylyltransferase [Polyangiaceae bacterium]
MDRPGPLLERFSSTLASELKLYVARHRAAVESMIREGGEEGGLPAARRHAKSFDGVLASLFQAVQAVLCAEGSWRPASLGAVGSYGRRVVAFGSDLDVRLLCEADPDGAARLAEALLYPLWDAGLTIGHQVVTPEQLLELARADLPTATTLLDWRTVSGEPGLADAMLRRAFEGLFGAGAIGGFLEQLATRASQRHERYGGSVYLLEPDVKNGPGGLRDLDVAHWAARARWRVAELGELVRLGVLVPREWQRIEESQNLLWRIRNLLHLSAGRRSDRLSFERQEQLAAELGYGSSASSVERLMSEYYRNARVLAWTREMIVERAMPPPLRRPHELSIGAGLKLINDAVSFGEPSALEDEPALAFRLYDEAVQRGAPVYPFARDAVARMAAQPALCEKLRASEEAARLFTRLLTDAQRARFKNGSILQELHDVGLLVAMIPEFSPVVGRVHHDVYHVLTVDAHSVAAVDRLKALVRGELAAEHALASRLAAEVARPRVLFFATLLHDVGKDLGGGSHSERGAELAGPILERLRVPEQDIREVAHLVSKHLAMYHVATRRDVDDPRTISAFLGDVHGLEGLAELYLLTVADVSTTSPTAMTSWKARMLDELYLAAARVLSGEAPSPSDRDALVARVVELVGPRERGFLEHFLRAVPERYLVANEPADIARHAGFVAGAAGAPAAVAVVGADDPYVELAVLADDGPGLLARITAALSAARLYILGAQIYSFVEPSGRRRALDLFWVRSGSEAEAARAAAPRVERELRRLIAGELTAAELLGGQGRPSRLAERPTPGVASKVTFDDRASVDHTVIEVITRDRPALLFWLAHTLQEAGLEIALAKINTEGTRVADVFYVTDASGAKVADAARMEAIRARLLTAIARADTGRASP